ncbi:hypothetical protein [Lacticaseibacillus saniviri]|uniref:hypothetical protein n=1 Tax=Lacticaseibacillus saniviri TaxID=931533 RepID=UPI000704DE27|nr:hypothetical protein [Lacticaseibacillus saniviri]
MWDKVKTYPEHFWLGVGLIAIGVWLITNDRFFMWPPYAVDFFNDDLFGGFFVADGLGLLLWLLEGSVSVKWNRRFITIAACLMGFLSSYQFLIWVATGHYMSWISNTIITAFVLIMARRSDTRES